MLRLLLCRVVLFCLYATDTSRAFCFYTPSTIATSKRHTGMATQSQDTVSSFATPNGPFVKVAVVEIKPDRVEEFVDLCKIAQPASVKGEPGCIRLDVLTMQGSTNKFIIYEIFDDEAAYQYHVDQPYSQKIGEFVKSGGVANEMPFLANGLLLTK